MECWFGVALWMELMDIDVDSRVICEDINIDTALGSIFSNAALVSNSTSILLNLEEFSIVFCRFCIYSSRL